MRPPSSGVQATAAVAVRAEFRITAISGCSSLPEALIHFQAGWEQRLWLMLGSISHVRVAAQGSAAPHTTSTALSFSYGLIDWCSKTFPHTHPLCRCLRCRLKCPGNDIHRLASPSKDRIKLRLTIACKLLVDDGLQPLVGDGLQASAFRGAMRRHLVIVVIHRLSDLVARG
jgi:hypothetical protein